MPQVEQPEVFFEEQAAELEPDFEDHDVSFGKPFTRWTFAAEAEILDRRRRVRADRAVAVALEAIRWQWRADVARRIPMSGKQEMESGADWAPVVDLNGKTVLGEWRIEQAITSGWEAVEAAINAGWAAEGYEWEVSPPAPPPPAVGEDGAADGLGSESEGTEESEESEESESDEDAVVPGPGQAVALYDWVAQDASQLSVAADQMLDLVVKPATLSAAEAAEEEAELTKAFESIDADGSGSVDEAEFGELCREMDPHMTQPAVKRALAAIDSDGDGDISLGEFREWWLSGDRSLLPSLRTYWVRVRTLASGPKPLAGWAAVGLVPRDYVQTDEQYAQTYRGLAESFGLKGDGPISDAEIHTMFGLIDEDGSGLLDRQEVEKMLRGLGRPLSPADLDAAMTLMDGDGSGEVDADEFREWWRATERAEATERQRRADAATARKKAKEKQAAFVNRHASRLGGGRKKAKGAKSAKSAKSDKAGGSGGSRPAKAVGSSAPSGPSARLKLQSAVKVVTAASRPATNRRQNRRQTRVQRKEKDKKEVLEIDSHRQISNQDHEESLAGFLDQKWKSERTDDAASPENPYEIPEYEIPVRNCSPSPSSADDHQAKQALLSTPSESAPQPAPQLTPPPPATEGTHAGAGDADSAPQQHDAAQASTSDDQNAAPAEAATAQQRWPSSSGGHPESTEETAARGAAVAAVVGRPPVAAVPAVPVPERAELSGWGSLYRTSPVSNQPATRPSSAHIRGAKASRAPPQLSSQFFGFSELVGRPSSASAVSESQSSMLLLRTRAAGSGQSAANVRPGSTQSRAAAAAKLRRERAAATEAEVRRRMKEQSDSKAQRATSKIAGCRQRKAIAAAAARPQPRRRTPVVVTFSSDSAPTDELDDAANVAQLPRSGAEQDVQSVAVFAPPRAAAAVAGAEVAHAAHHQATHQHQHRQAPAAAASCQGATAAAVPFFAAAQPARPHSAAARIPEGSRAAGGLSAAAVAALAESRLAAEQEARAAKEAADQEARAGALFELAEFQQRLGEPVLRRQQRPSSAAARLSSGGTRSAHAQLANPGLHASRLTESVGSGSGTWVQSQSSMLGLQAVGLGGGGGRPAVTWPRGRAAARPPRPQSAAARMRPDDQPQRANFGNARAGADPKQVRPRVRGSGERAVQLDSRSRGRPASAQPARGKPPPSASLMRGRQETAAISAVAGPPEPRQPPGPWKSPWEKRSGLERTEKTRRQKAAAVASSWFNEDPSMRAQNSLGTTLVATGILERGAGAHSRRAVRPKSALASSRSRPWSP